MTIKPMVAALSALMLVACGSDDDSSSNDTKTQDISLKFSASVGADAVVCGANTTLVGTGDGGNGRHAPEVAVVAAAACSRSSGRQW